MRNIESELNSVIFGYAFVFKIRQKLNNIESPLADSSLLVNSVHLQRAVKQSTILWTIVQHYFLETAFSECNSPQPDFAKLAHHLHYSFLQSP